MTNAVIRIFDISGNSSRDNIKTIVRTGLNWRADSRNLQVDFNRSIKIIKNG